MRLIVASDGSLEQAVAAGRFREELYYALDAASLTLHPLRERADDILPLAPTAGRAISASSRPYCTRRCGAAATAASPPAIYS